MSMHACIECDIKSEVFLMHGEQGIPRYIENDANASLIELHFQSKLES